MKKVIAWILVLVMALTFAACNGNATGTESTKATNNSLHTPGNPTDGTQSATSSTAGGDTPAETNPAASTAPSENDSVSTEPAETKPETTDPSATDPAPTTPAHTHTWEDATCTTAKTCKTCAATEGFPKGHEWEAATCTAPRTCKVCNVTEGNAAGHAWKDATCTTVKTCQSCGATEGGVIEHDYANGDCSMCGAAAPVVTKTVYLLTGVVYDDGEGRKTTTNYYYNEAGFLTKITETVAGYFIDGYRTESTEYTVTERTGTGLPLKLESTKGIISYEYGSSGNLLKIKSSFDEYIYDETGFLLWESHTSESYYGQTTSSYEKNEHGLIAKEICSDGYVTLYSYAFDSKGRVVRQEMTSSYDVTAYKNYYDEADRLVKQECLFVDPTSSEEWVATKDWYTYDNTGNLINKSSVAYGEMDYLEEYTYTYQAIQVSVDSLLDRLDVLNLIR